MPALGEYEIVQELHRGPFGSVYSACRTGDRGAATAGGAEGATPAPRLVIKTCTPAVDVVGLNAAVRLVREFEQRAALQQRLGATDGQGAGAALGSAQPPWAKVHAIGRCPGRSIGDEPAGRPGEELPGAYVVMDYAQGGSLQRVIRSRVELDGASLRRIAGEIAAGLVLVRKVAGRGHGNLRASNILLLTDGQATNEKDAPAGLEQLHARLADPAPAWASTDEEAEIKAFAEIIHELVTHKAFQGGWSGGQQQWSALGSSGVAWRKLVETILDPSASSGDGRVAGYSVEDLPGAIAKTAAAAGARRNVLAAAALVLALGGGVGGYFYWQHMQDVRKGRIVQRWLVEPQAAVNWKEFCTEYRDWFAFFLKRLDEKPSQAVLTAAQQSGANAAPVNVRRDLYMLDSELSKIVQELDTAKVRAPGSPGRRGEDPTSPWEMAGVSEGMDLLALAAEPTEAAKTDASIVATESMRAVIASVREKLTAWHGPDVLKDAGKDLDSVGWTRAGKYLGSLAERLSGGAAQGATQGTLSADVAADIDAVVAVRPRVESIRTRWKNIQDSFPAINAIEDPVASKFAQVAPRLVKDMDGEAGRASDLAKLDQQLLKIEEQARKLAEFASKQWVGVDVEAFRESPAYTAMAREPSPTLETFEEWARTASSFPTLDPTLDPRNNWGVDEALAAIEGLEKEFSVEPLESPVEPATAQKISELKAAVAAAARNKLYWNRRNQQKIEAEAARLKQETGTLRTALEQRKTARVAELAATARKVREDLKAKAELVSGSPAINATWAKGRDALLDSIAPERFKELTRRANELESALKKIDAGLPAAVKRDELIAAAGGGGGGPGVEWADALANAAIAERDRRITSVIGEGAPDAQRLAGLESAVAQAGQAFTGWIDGVKALGRSAAMLAARLGLGYGVDDPGTDGSISKLSGMISADPAMKDAAIAGAIKPVLDRVEALRALSGEKDPARLVAMVRTPDAAKPELPLGAWRRLGDVDIAWPATDTDLDEMAAMRESVQRVIAGVGDQARRSDLMAVLLTRETPRRFAAFAQSRKTVAELDRALGKAAALGIEPEQLPEALRYNVMLSSLRRSLEQTKPEDLAAYDAGRKFMDDVRALGAQVSGDQRVQAMLSRVADLTAERPGEVKKIDPKTLGPGSLGGAFQATEDPNTGRLTFTGGGGRKPVTLEFERVEADPSLGTEAFYIAKNEASVGMVLGLIDTNEKRTELLGAMTSEDDLELLNGPRVWTRAQVSQSNDAKTLAKNPFWLVTDANVTKERPAFAPGIVAPGEFKKIADEHGGDPSLDHPMQRVSPFASAYVTKLAGCRLPTSAEWKAAYKAWVTDKGLANNNWNLRDRTFELQRAHVQAMQDQVPLKTSFQWPDIDIAPLDPKAAKGAKAKSLESDDGVLFFAKVDADKCELHHLVGNVAEYVFDDPAAIELVPGQGRLPVAKVINSNASALRIIGGSALSAPSAPIDDPRAVLDERGKPDLLAAQDGFTDVGFRLAFGASGTAIKVEPLAVKIRKALSDEAFMLGQ